MGFYIRYITTDKREITLKMIQTALQDIEPSYGIISTEPDALAGDILYGDELCGELEINTPGDDLFDEDIEDLKELVNSGEDEIEQQILSVLNRAQMMIVVRPVWGDATSAEAALDKLDPLWDWLFDHREGLLQVDGEGYYDRTGLILDSNLKI